MDTRRGTAGSAIGLIVGSIVVLIAWVLAAGGIAAAGTDEPDERLVTRSDLTKAGVPSGLKLETSSSGERTVISVPALDSACRSQKPLFPEVEEAATSLVEFLDEQRQARLLEVIEDFDAASDAKTYFAAWRSYTSEATECSQVVEIVGDREVFRGEVRRLKLGQLGDDLVATLVFPENARRPTSCSAVVRLGTTIVDVRLFDKRGLATKTCTRLVRTAVTRAGS